MFDLISPFPFLLQADGVFYGILYISNKGVAEMGSHAELMEKRGMYSQLYTAQVREEAA